MRNNYFSISVIFACILILVVPEVSLVDSKEMIKDQNREKYYYPHNMSRIPYVNFSKFLKIPEIENTVVENSEQTITLAVGDGLMNSSWPMYCHDEHHTGRSPYSTMNLPSAMKWYVKDEDDYMEGSSIIDVNGTIYCGSYQLYAVSPNGTVKWKTKTDGIIYSAPAIDKHGTIYFGTAMIGRGWLYAVTSGGVIKWRFYVGDEIYSSPVIDSNGTIYFGSLNYNFYAIYPNGILKWEYNTGHFIFSSPTLGLDGSIYVGALGPGDDGYLYAFNPNGTVKWSYNAGWVHGSAAVGEDGTIYAVSDDVGLYALYPNNGTIKWQCNQISGAWTTPIIGKDGTIYVGNSRGGFYAVRPNGTIKWMFPLSGGFWFGPSAALSSDGTIYFGTTNALGGSGGFYALNASTGKEKWNYTDGSWYETSPAISNDGTVYISACYDWTPNGVDFYMKGYLFAFGKGPLRSEANGPYSGFMHQAISFTGTPFGGIPPYTYHWNFADGTSSDQQNPSHIYAKAGTYNATFIVTDSTGNHSTDTATVTIYYPPPKIIVLKPRRAIYVENIPICPFLKPIIYGPITIKALVLEFAPPGTVSIDHVDFEVWGDLVKTFTHPPYRWLWYTFDGIKKNVIDIIAYDTAGHSSRITIDVLRLI